MKRRVAIIILCLLIPILFGGCASDMTAAQRGAVGGGAAGAVGGAILGGSAKGALIGAGVGALGGALVNDAIEKEKKK
ncbi:MAG: hypothetical protein JSW56_07675 [Deltaproteobacteria bacterium]|nr:MAG: hypothetical protein JSW56_07675 [Deltaproteobacteria bacterium]